MMPLDVALRLASASATCEKHKCPYMAQCKGDYLSCQMKEVAMIIRSQAAEIETLTAMVKGLQEIMSGASAYIQDLEKINRQYHDLCIAFQHGYRPKKNVRKPYKPRKKKNVEEMDGDARYAFNPEKKEPEPPPVVI